MTRVIDGVMVIEAEEPDVCAYCGECRELRPYGRDDARICHPCAMKPENIQQTERAFAARLSGVTAAARLI